MEIVAFLPMLSGARDMLKQCSYQSKYHKNGTYAGVWGNKSNAIPTRKKKYKSPQSVRLEILAVAKGGLNWCRLQRNQAKWGGRRLVGDR